MLDGVVKITDMPTVPELPYLSLKKRMERESP